MNQRRLFIASGLATAASSMLPHKVFAADKLKIGFVYPGPIADSGWTFQHDLGRKMVEKEFGNKVETVYVEKVPESADAERVMRDLIANGCNMIFTTSFGFMNPTIKVAADNPKVVFEHCSGYKTAPNVGIYQTRCSWLCSPLPHPRSDSQFGRLCAGREKREPENHRQSGLGQHLV
jgi:simple sugar transport system substrate-binding protein